MKPPNKFIVPLAWILWYLQPVSSSIYTHHGVGLQNNDYCEQLHQCLEGSHTICVNNPDIYHRLAPNCNGQHNISIRLDNKNMILSFLNQVRAKIANGKETGYEGQKLPRGYSLWRLEWDYHLAYNAQATANRCELKHDLCRATWRFHNPGQLIGMMRFRHPTWEPIQKDNSFVQADLDNGELPASTIKYAVKRILRRWYHQKNNVTGKSIIQGSDRLRRTMKTFLKRFSGQGLYLQMVTARVEAVGCGISADTNYMYTSNDDDLIYNFILLVCNFSHKPPSNVPVYPSMLTFRSGGCQCPDGTVADEQCLCNPVPIKAKYSTNIEPAPEENCKKTGGKCLPRYSPISLLPIITIQEEEKRKRAAPSYNTYFYDNNSRYEPMSSYTNYFGRDRDEEKSIRNPNRENSFVSDPTYNMRAIVPINSIIKELPVSRRAVPHEDFQYSRNIYTGHNTGAYPMNEPFIPSQNDSNNQQSYYYKSRTFKESSANNTLNSMYNEDFQRPNYERMSYNYNYNPYYQQEMNQNVQGFTRIGPGKKHGMKPNLHEIENYRYFDDADILKSVLQKKTENDRMLEMNSYNRNYFNDITMSSRIPNNIRNKPIRFVDNSNGFKSKHKNRINSHKPELERSREMKTFSKENDQTITKYALIPKNRRKELITLAYFPKVKNTENIFKVNPMNSVSINRSKDYNKLEIPLLAKNVSDDLMMKNNFKFVEHFVRPDQAEYLKTQYKKSSTSDSSKKSENNLRSGYSAYFGSLLNRYKKLVKTDKPKLSSSEFYRDVIRETDVRMEDLV